MTINDIKNRIQFENQIKVYFKLATRSPIIGKFIKLSDHEEKYAKGYIRFISENNRRVYQEGDLSVAKLILIESISWIEKVPEYATVRN